MIKKVFEPLLYLAMLITMIVIGIILCCSGQPYKIALGVGGLVMTLGEASYLVPRILSDVNDALELDFMNGVGKGFSAITRILFLLMLYHICAEYFDMPYNIVTGIIYTFATVGVIMIVLPQNQWLENKEQTLLWKTIRNIPLYCLGLCVILCYAVNLNYTNGLFINYFWIGITLFLVSYLPVFIFEEKYPSTHLFMVLAYSSLLSILVLGLFLT